MRDRTPTLERRVEQAEAQAVLDARLAQLAPRMRRVLVVDEDATEVIAAADVADDLEPT